MPEAARAMRRSIHSPPYVALRDVLTKARIEAGLTQEQLAAKLSRPQSYVAKYETGDRRLDVIELVEVCLHVRVKPENLLETVRKAL
jgi:transcriptional regulator with XRE-family HTH domain